MSRSFLLAVSPWFNLHLFLVLQQIVEVHSASVALVSLFWDGYSLLESELRDREPRFQQKVDSRTVNLEAQTEWCWPVGKHVTEMWFTLKNREVSG